MARVGAEYALDFEARQALMGLIIRTVDAIRFGIRELDLEELRSLASTWSYLNDGLTPTEAVLRLSKDQQ